MDKNLLLAIALSVGVYALWFGVVEKKISPPSPVPGPAQPAVPAQPLAGAGKAAAVVPGPAAPAAPRKSREQLAREAVSARIGQSRVWIHPRGAAIVSWVYPGPKDEIELVGEPSPGYFATFPELEFKRRGVSDGGPIEFAAARADGLRVVKEFLPESREAMPRLRLTLSNAGAKPLQLGSWSLSLGPGLDTIESEKKENAKLSRVVGLRPPSGPRRGKVEVLKSGPATGEFRWVGVDNRYFLSAVVPPPDFTIGSIFPPPQLTLQGPDLTLAPGEHRSWDIPFYMGAKGQTWLSHYHAGLERSIDFGFFAQLGRWMLRALGVLRGLIGNWGWAIIALTVLLQILLFPLTYKSLKATASMKRLQPEIARLQQKYGKDPQKLNVEMMELYKRSGANPLGGCLPILLQMPIFIALFNALRNAWELHGAPWILWISDLSVKDPYYVLPIIMGGLMFVQNRMNPPSTDPAQAKVMQFMPLIFTFMFLNFPSGLVLYWMTSSLLSTAQMIALKRRLEA